MHSGRWENICGWTIVAVIVCWKTFKSFGIVYIRLFAGVYIDNHACYISRILCAASDITLLLSPPSHVRARDTYMQCAAYAQTHTFEGIHIRASIPK